GWEVEVRDLVAEQGRERPADAVDHLATPRCERIVDDRPVNVTGEGRIEPCPAVACPDAAAEPLSTCRSRYAPQVVDVEQEMRLVLERRRRQQRELGVAAREARSLRR